MGARSYNEFQQLDDLLEAFTDGLPHSNKAIYNPDKVSPFEVSRIMNQLLSDGYLKDNGQDTIITSKGKMFVKEGGYKGLLRAHRRNTSAFWLSIFDAVVALGALITAIIAL